MKFSEKQLRLANHVNMYNYMRDRGADWQKFSAKEDLLPEHDSMKANTKTGVVTWWSQGGLSSFNNAVEFAQKVYPEDDHDELVSSLLDYGIKEINNQDSEVKTPTRKQASFSLQEIQHGNGDPVKDTGKLNDAGKRYLTDKRFLNGDTVALFDRLGLVTSDTRGNILFHWRRDHQTIGVDQQGVRKRPLKSRVHVEKDGSVRLDRPYFKGIGVNSASDGGFRFTAIQDPQRLVDNPNAPVSLYVCEAPIEAMSLLELNLRAGEVNGQKDNAHYLSMSGLKQHAVYREISDLRRLYGDEHPINVVMSTNADGPGQGFIKRVLHDYKGVEDKPDNVHWKLLQPNIKNADWNEMLEYQKTGELATREEKTLDLSKAEALLQPEKLTPTENESPKEVPAQTQAIGRGA